MIIISLERCAWAVGCCWLAAGVRGWGGVIVVLVVWWLGDKAMRSD